jgi:hypothetical protein
MAPVFRLLYLGLALAPFSRVDARGKPVARHPLGMECPDFFYLAWDEMARLHETFRMWWTPLREMGTWGRVVHDHFGAGGLWPLLAWLGLSYHRIPRNFTS